MSIKRKYEGGYPLDILFNGGTLGVNEAVGMDFTLDELEGDNLEDFE